MEYSSMENTAGSYLRYVAVEQSLNFNLERLEPIESSKSLSAVSGSSSNCLAWIEHGPIPRPLALDIETVYLCSIIRHIAEPGNVLANPEAWKKFIISAAHNEILALAARACGALEIEHLTQAMQYQQHAIGRIRQALTDGETGFSIGSNTEICSAILMLINYELMRPDPEQSLVYHLQGLTSCLKEHAAYYTRHGKDPQLRYMSANPDASGMVYQAYRSIECLLAVWRKSAPLLSYAEYECLMNSRDCRTQDEGDALTFWRILHHCASSFSLKDPEKLSSIQHIKLQYEHFSWHGAEILGLSQTATDKRPTPFASGLSSHKPSRYNFQKAAVMQALVEVSVLRLNLTLGAEELFEHRTAVLLSADRVAQFLDLLITENCDWARSWLSIISTFLFEAYSQVLPAHDARLSWIHGIVTTKFTSGITGVRLYSWLPDIWHGLDVSL